MTAAKTISKKSILEELCDTIEATGGIDVHADGTATPQADEEWVDLGDVYLKACGFLNRSPKYNSHAAYPIEDWANEASNGDTKLGYSDWIEHKIESEETAKK